MPSSWVTALSWAALAPGSAGWIVLDIYGQRMGIMEGVWPVTALYFGPAAAAA
jgi:hypothetical protein